MARYIDADKLIGWLNSSTADTWGKGLGKSWWAHSVKLKDNIIDGIEKMPTADVAEVKHGEWVQQLNPYEDEIHCSVCGAVFNVIDNCTETFDYCPHCGAKMDGERKENEDDKERNT